MNVLFDIGHPAHVHVFKNIAFRLIEQNHKVLFTVRSGESETELLKHLHLSYYPIGKRKKGILNKLTGLLIFSFKILIIAHRNKIDLFVSHGSMYAGYASFFRGKPHIALEDTGNMEQIRFSRPVSNVILSPEYLQKNLGKKHLRYKGFHELSYLHPIVFNPGNDILSKIGATNKDIIILLRFSSWNASHDFNIQGFDNNLKNNLINILSGYGKVFISSESELPEEYKSYQLKLPPEELHNLLPKISLYIGEGATTASECAILGVPAIYFNPKIHGVIQAQAKYGLLYHFRTTDGIIDKAIDILTNKNLKNTFKKGKEKLIKDHINVAGFLSWFVLLYPESEKIFRSNPDIQYTF